MYAIIETGGKQVKVEKDQVIYVEKLDAEVGSEVTFDKVLFLGGDKTVIGAPYVKGAKVTAKVEKQGRAKKIIIFKYVCKNNERRKHGHRQSYTKLTITGINA